MSKQSENVKSWRRRFRLRVLEAMGGKCACCGYDKCDLGFDVHHLDPKEKDFTFAAIRGSPRAVHTLVRELRRCTLLCKLCHLEVHAGLRPWPKESSFNEVKYLELISTPQPRVGNRFGAL